NQIMLESGAGRRIARAFEWRHERLRRLIQRTGPEDEHETAVPRIAPLDVPDACHASVDGAAKNIEADRVADIDAGPLVCALLDRHFRLGRRAVPELPLDDSLVRLQVI